MSVTAETVTFPYMIFIENALKITNKPIPPILSYDLAAAVLATAVLSRNLDSFIRVVFYLAHAFHEADPLSCMALVKKNTHRKWASVINIVSFENQSSTNQTHDTFERKLHQTVLKRKLAN
jgi:hypothetical protein